MSGVKIENAIKRYGDLQVIHGVDLEIQDGEFCVLVGPSGCGKSTLLRMIAGLEETSDGRISIGSRDVTDADPAERGVAMVFQTYALYPHMNVEQNMGFGLKMNGVPAPEIREKVAKAAEILKLQPYLKRKPKALSGGGSASVWRLAGRLCVGQRCFYLMSLFPIWMQNCVWICGWRLPICIKSLAQP